MCQADTTAVGSDGIAQDGALQSDVNDWPPIRSYDLTDETEQLKLAQKLYARYLTDRADINPLFDKAATRLIAGIQVAIDHALKCAHT